jgi:hypothetical protein
MIQIASLFIFTVGLLLFIFFLIRECQEIFFLRKILKNILNKDRIENNEDMIRIKDYLNRIKYNKELRTIKRPLLRHTATHILKHNYGFCGENARVAIKFFLLSGIKSSRIYLYGSKWGHVVMEQKYKGQWYLFDGHYDPKTVLNPDQITFIKSEDLKSYPNDYSENEYLDFCRIKLFYNISFLKIFSKNRLPSIVIYIFESPFLIKTIFSFVLSLIGLTIFYLNLECL